MPKLTTNVYIDGFNLYRGCVKGTPYRWLNLSKLCTMLLPGHQINRIRYFTALVQPTPFSPQKLQHQLTYIRALKTIPNLTDHYGQFRTHTVRRPLASPPPGSPRFVEILDRKEKGSDVNLATYMLVDGFKKEYEMAVVISNDSDLVEPIKLLQSELGLRVGVIHPHVNVVHELRDAAEFYRHIRERAIKNCQFPNTLTDTDGTITKPADW